MFKEELLCLLLVCDLINLNFGSGREDLEGWLNLDKDNLDLDCFPYPFSDDSVDNIRMNHVLEHLKNPYRVLVECHRILRPEGKLVVRMPSKGDSIMHYRTRNGIDTMDCFNVDAEQINLQYRPYFDIKVKGNTRGLKKIIYNLYREFLNLIFTEWEYEFTKKN